MIADRAAAAGSAPGYRRGLRLRGHPERDVVVVTGATGPVGRAVVRALAARGAHPVLLDAPGTDLEDAARACVLHRVPATTVAADVTDPESVRDAAAEAVRRCGRIDGWVQCPGAGAVGGLLDLPPDEVRRVLDADVLGALHGARAALPHLAAGGGVLVLVASLHGQVARPFAAPAGMAGAAVRVLAAALRQELRRGGVRGVAVTTVLAPEVDGGARPFPAGRPERIARTVVGRLRHPGLEKVAGGPLATALVHGHALVPGATEWLVAQWSGRSRHG